jgi:CDGSH-type Zn-finger protein
MKRNARANRGERMRRKDEITIVRVTSEGPLLVRGPLRLLDEQGNAVSTRRKVNALCRCGRSAAQPFCDGTHKIVPFRPRAVRGASASARGPGSPPC